MSGTICTDENRRQLVRDRGLNGIDFIEVLCPDQKLLCVHLFGKEGLERISVQNVRIEGGRRIRDIKVEYVDRISRDEPELEDCLRVKLDKLGDLSTYTLRLVDAKEGVQTNNSLPGFDPRYSHAEFSLKACCSSDLDCKTERVCPPKKLNEPEIDYLAKDYAGFRQLILDRLALIMPDWQEIHIPDLGIALVELLAFTGDYLSYYQDAVATEAYLDTARQRISVRRHAKLVDYQMHEGCNARAWVCMDLEGASNHPINFKDTYFITGCDELKAPKGTILKSDDLKSIPVGNYEVFEPLADTLDKTVILYEAHNKIEFYTWGDQECCLPKGSIRATLRDNWESQSLSSASQMLQGEVKATTPIQDTSCTLERKLHIKVGDILIFEEVIGPETGIQADADPKHRQAVRLTKVELGVDTLFEPSVPILEIEWEAEDALKFPLCISTTLPGPECTKLENVSVVSGNVILVDHGRTIEPAEELGTVGMYTEESRCNCAGIPDVVYTAEEFYPVLQEVPLTFSQQIDPNAPASKMLMQDPPKALPQITVIGLPFASGESVSSDHVSWQWRPKHDLLDSSDEYRKFVVEVDNEGCAHLLFGNGELGKMPDINTNFKATYRIGNGLAGNVGREKITYLVMKDKFKSGVNIKPRNPLPAYGGTDQEPVEKVKLLAPHTYRKRLERAITANDYAEITVRNEKLQKASATLQWTGSWYEAHVAIDPKGKEEADYALCSELEKYLHPYRRIGQDLVVSPAVYVPLDLTIFVCVLPQYIEGNVKAALLERFSNRILPDGTLGYFHPDNLTFGKDITVSSIIAAAQGVQGVKSVSVNLRRLFDGDIKSTDNPCDSKINATDSILKFGVREIPQLDNDPSFPENGKLTICIGGGR
jgi:hypothetical protein